MTFSRRLHPKQDMQDRHNNKQYKEEIKCVEITSVFVIYMQNQMSHLQSWWWSLNQVSSTPFKSVLSDQIWICPKNTSRPSISIRHKWLDFLWRILLPGSD